MRKITRIEPCGTSQTLHCIFKGNFVKSNSFESVIEITNEKCDKIRIKTAFSILIKTAFSILSSKIEFASIKLKMPPTLLHSYKGNHFRQLIFIAHPVCDSEKGHMGYQSRKLWKQQDVWSGVSALKAAKPPHKDNNGPSKNKFEKF